MVVLVAAFGRRTEMDDSKLPGTEDGQEGLQSGAAGVISLGPGSCRDKTCWNRIICSLDRTMPYMRPEKDQ